jgi:hypothetical protein
VTPPSLPTVYTASAVGAGGVANSEVADRQAEQCSLTAVPAAVEIPQNGFMYFVVGSARPTDSRTVQLSVDGPAQPGVTFQFIPSRITRAPADLKVSVGAATLNVTTSRSVREVCRDRCEQDVAESFTVPARGITSGRVSDLRRRASSDSQPRQR